jgi:hypothetical protein
VAGPVVGGALVPVSLIRPVLLVGPRGTVSAGGKTIGKETAAGGAEAG